MHCDICCVSVCVWLSSAIKQGQWAVLLWPYLLITSIPLDCRDEQGGLSRCPSISQEKLLDRVIQHAELIYRVSEESCSLFVSSTDHYPYVNLCTCALCGKGNVSYSFRRPVVSMGSYRII